MPKLVYDFAEGHKDLKDLLGGKGANLAEMTRMGLPVPPGFVITTEACQAYLGFDANDFRLLRQEELRLSALTVAQRVRESNTPYRFNPMNSRERRVVHLALRGETDLRTESAGVGPGRHVVVYPAGMASLPDLPPQPAFRGDGPGHGGGFGRGPGGGGRRPGGGGPPPRRGRR